MVEVLRGLGVTPAAPLSWDVGAAVRDAYTTVYGAPPMKALRPKTNGTGTHCFATYPDEFRPLAEAVARERLAEAVVDRQGALPFGDDDQGALPFD